MLTNHVYKYNEKSLTQIGPAQTSVIKFRRINLGNSCCYLMYISLSGIVSWLYENIYDHFQSDLSCFQLLHNNITHFVDYHHLAACVTKTIIASQKWKWSFAPIVIIIIHQIWFIIFDWRKWKVGYTNILQIEKYTWFTFLVVFLLQCWNATLKSVCLPSRHC